MSDPRPLAVAILGGYGNTGRLIAERLVRTPGTTVIVIGRDGARASRLAASLAVAGGTAIGRAADVADPASLAAALEGADLVLSATTMTPLAPKVARAALDRSIDYMDIHLSSAAKWAGLSALVPEIEAKGLTFITDGGFHPGVPAAMVRAMARQVELEAANVMSCFNIDWSAREFAGNAPEDFVAELRDMRPAFLAGGAWRTSWSGVRKYDFGPPHGVKQCVPMDLMEMHALAERLPALRETGFFVGGFGGVVDTLVMPLSLLALKLLPCAVKPVGRLFMASLKRFCPEDEWIVLELAGHGRLGDRPVAVGLRLAFGDAYLLTALAALAAIEEYRESPPRPGLHAQALYVDPERFLGRLARYGVDMKQKVMPL